MAGRQRRDSVEQLSDHLPPQDLDAERAVLGAVILDQERKAFDDVAQILRGEDFYSDPHRRIWLAIVEMEAEGKGGIDIVTLARRLTKRGDFEAVGGVPYLNQIMESVAIIEHASYYANIVKEKSYRRLILEEATQMIRVAHDPSQEYDAILQDVDRRVAGLIEQRGSGKAEDIGDIMLAVFDELEKGTIRGRSTGLIDVDEITGGVRPGEVIVVAARPAVGKSALATSIMYTAANAFRSCLMFSFEMTSLQLGTRLLSMASGVHGHKLRTGELEDGDQDALIRAASGLKELPFYIKCDSQMTMLDVQAVSRVWKRKHDIEMVIIDYLQLITPADRRVQREQQVAEMSRACKVLALTLNVPIILLSQLNRNADKQEPRLSDLRESGAIEQDADQVWLLHIADEEKPTERTLIVAKNRSGRTGKTKLQFNSETTQFRNHTEERDIW